MLGTSLRQSVAEAQAMAVGAVIELACSLLLSFFPYWLTSLSLYVSDMWKEDEGKVT